MSRNILLVEPNYSNKYPPIGLMKIATYHRMLGDRVRFYKGDLQDLVVENLWHDCLRRLTAIDDSVDWSKNQIQAKQYLKTKKSELLFLAELNLEQNRFKDLILACFNDYADIFKKKKTEQYPKYDRVYVTTLFTFYWNITIQTINFCKDLVADEDQLMVGGVLATLLAAELEAETGIKPKTGLLDQTGELDPDVPEAANIVVDNLPLDYSILDEIDYQYPTRSAYFTFMTKGCTRKCAFCSVPFLEPTYKPKIDTIDKFSQINQQYGEQQNLLLMDNNVLASPKFGEIIDEIKAMGFYKGASYVEPNQLNIAVENLKSSYNDFGFTRRAFRLLHDLVPRLKEPAAQNYYNVLAEYDLLDESSITKQKILMVYPLVAEMYEKYRIKSARLRYVDFNQGTDCRYVTKEKMKKMSEIPIRPLRIAFDYLGLKDTYVKAIELAAENGIKELSNYILYNFRDKPEELYTRLEINAKLCQDLNVNIFSFPMKYIPLFKEEAKDRSYTGKHWNKKFTRAIQSILNVTKGIVAPSKRGEKTSFFREAFGKDLTEFRKILYMPETYIVYRHLFRYDLKYTEVWESEYDALSKSDRQIANQIIEGSDFSPATLKQHNLSKPVCRLLRHYTISRHRLGRGNVDYEQIKAKFDDLILNDQFIELTLTYDYD